MKHFKHALAGLFFAALLSGCGAKDQQPVAMTPAPSPTPAPQRPAPTSPMINASMQVEDQTPLSRRMVEFHDSGQMLQAIGAANRVIKNGGSSVAKAYYIRGSAEGQLRDFGLAAQDLKTATQKSPNDEMAWFSRAWYEYELGDVDQAIQTGEKAVSLNPKSSMAWLNLGLCYAVKNNAAKAQRCYEAGQKLADRGVIREAMRDIDNGRQRYPKSEKTLDQAMKWITGE